MINKIFKLLGKAGKTAKNTLNESTEFIDKTLEKEYITSAIDKAKDLTGEAVTKAGELYGKAKQEFEELKENEHVAGIVDKAQELKSEVEKAGIELSSKAMQNETVQKVMSEAMQAKVALEQRVKEFTSSDEEE